MTGQAEPACFLAGPLRLTLYSRGCAHRLSAQAVARTKLQQALSFLSFSDADDARRRVGECGGEGGEGGGRGHLCVLWNESEPGCPARVVGLADVDLCGRGVAGVGG